MEAITHYSSQIGCRFRVSRNGELIFQSKEEKEEEDIVVKKKENRRRTRTSVRVERVGREGERLKEHERRNIFKQIVYSPTVVEFIST